MGATLKKQVSPWPTSNRLTLLEYNMGICDNVSSSPSGQLCKQQHLDIQQTLRTGSANDQQSFGWWFNNGSVNFNEICQKLTLKRPGF